MALGIGLNTAVFSVVSGVLWRDLRFPESERLVQLFDRVDDPPQETAATTSALVTQVRTESRSFDRVAAGTLRPAVVVEHGDPRRLSRMAVPIKVDPPILVQGSSLGFRIVARQGEKAIGRLVVRLDGKWVETDGWVTVIR